MRRKNVFITTVIVTCLSTWFCISTFADNNASIQTESPVVTAAESLEAIPEETIQELIQETSPVIFHDENSGPQIVTEHEEEQETIEETEEEEITAEVVVENAEPETEAVTEAAPAPSYTEQDLNILAHVLAGEAQCCPDEEQLYVGSVVLNRVNHKGYPNTIKEVVFQRKQYACIRDGNYYREPTAANWRNAQWLLENGSILPGHVIFQAKGRQGSGVYLETEYHKYCY